MDSTAFDSISENVLINVEFEDAIDVHVLALEHGVKLLSLGNVTGEAVKKNTTLALGIAKVCLNESNDELIGHELTALHDTISCLTEFRAGSDCVTEHVTGSQVADAKVIFDAWALSSLAGTWGSNHDDVHSGALGAFVSTFDLSEELIEIDVAKIHVYLECCLT